MGQMNRATAELLTAYFDGELSGEELAHAERLLKENPSWQKLLQDFQGISAQIAQIEAHRLEEDLSDKVLRQAEQQMLRGVPEGVDDPSSDPSNPANIVSLEELPLSTAPRMGIFGGTWTRTAMAVSALAAAAAVGFVLLIPPRGASDSARMAHRDEMAREVAVKEQRRAAIDTDRALETASSSAPAVESLDMADEQAEAKPALKRQALPTEDAGAPADFGQPAVAGNRAKGYRRSGAAPPAEANLVEKEPSKNQDALRLGASLQQRGQAGLAADKRKANGLKETGKWAHKAREADQLRALEGVTEQAYKALAESSDDVLVLKVKVTPQALLSGALDQALAQNQITFQQQAAGNLEVVDGSPKPQNAALEAGALAETKKATQAAEETADAIFVEASDEQIEALVHQLETQKDVFQQLSLAQTKLDTVIEPEPQFDAVQGFTASPKLTKSESAEAEGKAPAEPRRAPAAGAAAPGQFGGGKGGGGGAARQAPGRAVLRKQADEEALARPQQGRARYVQVPRRALQQDRAKELADRNASPADAKTKADKGDDAADAALQQVQELAKQLPTSAEREVERLRNRKRDEARPDAKQVKDLARRERQNKGEADADPQAGEKRADAAVDGLAQKPFRRMIIVIEVAEPNVPAARTRPAIENAAQQEQK